MGSQRVRHDWVTFSLSPQYSQSAFSTCGQHKRCCYFTFFSLSLWSLMCNQGSHHLNLDSCLPVTQLPTSQGWWLLRFQSLSCLTGLVASACDRVVLELSRLRTTWPAEVPGQEAEHLAYGVVSRTRWGGGLLLLLLSHFSRVRLCATP